jgi:hypothetical protein
MLYTNHVALYVVTHPEFTNKYDGYRLQRFKDHLYVLEYDALPSLKHLPSYPLTFMDWEYATNVSYLDGLHPERRLCHVNDLGSPPPTGYWQNSRYVGRVINTGLYTVEIEVFDLSQPQRGRITLTYSLWEFKTLFSKDGAEEEFMVQCLLQN